MYHCYDIASFDPKSERAQNENGQRGGEDGKGERDERGH